MRFHRTSNPIEKALLLAACLCAIPATARAQLQARTGTLDALCETLTHGVARPERACALTRTVTPGFELLELEGTATEDGLVLLVDTRETRMLRVVTVLESFESPRARFRRTFFTLERVERAHLGARTLLSLTTTRGIVDFDPDALVEHEDKRARVTLCIAEDEALRTLRCDVRFGVRRVRSSFAVVVPEFDPTHESWPYPRGLRRSRTELGAMYTILSTGRLLLRREHEAWPDEDDGFGDAGSVMRSLF